MTVTSSDPTHFLLTTDPTKVDTTSVTVQLTANSGYIPPVYVEAQNFSGSGVTAGVGQYYSQSTAFQPAMADQTNITLTEPAGYPTPVGSNVPHVIIATVNS